MMTALIAAVLLLAYGLFRLALTVVRLRDEVRKGLDGVKSDLWELKNDLVEGEAMMSQNPFQHCTDEELVGEASSRQGTVGGPLAEMVRRLKDAIQALERTSTELSQRIACLNVLLLGVTAAIGVLTLVQTLIAIFRR